MDKKQRKVSKAAKIVLKDLKKIGMFRGNYDGKHGHDEFMYGVMTVMEAIAYTAGENIGDKFTDEFGKNMGRCMDEAEVQNDDND